MGQTAGWLPDPYGVHELRFHSADGKPTLLVMDGGKTSYDRPPAADRPVAPMPPRGDESESAPAGVTPPVVMLTRPPQMVDTGAVATPTVTRTYDPEVREAHPTEDGSESAKAGDTPPPVVTLVRSPTKVDWDRAGTSAPTQTSDPNLAGNHSTPEVEQRSSEPLTRPFKIAYGIVFFILFLSVLGLVYVHYHHTGTGQAVGTARATTTTPSAAVTTTTVVPPGVLKPNPDTAANALVSSWAAGNKPAALTVATPTAVNTLFGVPYRSGLAEDRGCSTSFMPIVCTFGPPGGASPTDQIYEIDVSQAAGGWYVSAVKVQN